MTTLAVMKTRIADELARSDLTTQIAYAINDAIDAYNNERFHFSETRANTFQTVAGQEFYGPSDASWLGKMVVIDYVYAYNENQPYRLPAETPANIELLAINGTFSGIPWSYCWYGNQVRLYPIPDKAYTIRMGGAVKVDPPASDAETDNAWMAKAERLIRSRAKLELALHVLKDRDLADTMSVAVAEAFEDLKSETNQITQIERGRVKAMVL